MNASRIASTTSRATHGIEGVAAGTVDEIFQLGGAGADRRKPDRPGETAQAMGDLRQRRDRPARAERRHLVDEDADGIAPGGERGDETLPRLVENLLEGVDHGPALPFGRMTATATPCATAPSPGCRSSRRPAASRRSPADPDGTWR